MQSMLHLTSYYGLPLCVSSIRPPLTLSKEMADHDRRRKAVKKLVRSRARSRGVPELAFRTEEGLTVLEGIIFEGEFDGDLADLFRDPPHCSSSFTARAA